MTRLLAFLFFVSFANCCQRKNEVMSCHRLPETNERMVGVSILIVERVFGEKVDLRGFQLSKIMIKFSEVTCDGLLFGRDTQVFLGDKMCPIVSAELHPRQAFFTTTTLAETAAITFNTPWIIAAGISSLVVCSIAVCICAVLVFKRCAQRKRRAMLTAAMDDISETEFGQYQNVKLD